MVWVDEPLVRVPKTTNDTRDRQIKSFTDVIAELEFKNRELEDERRVLQRKLRQYRSGKDDLGLMSKGNLLALARPRKQICGVYFLIEDDDIVYVGQSINIDARVGQHHTTKTFSFVAYVECQQEKLLALEALYIHKFDPPLNGGGGYQQDMRGQRPRLEPSTANGIA